VLLVLWAAGHVTRTILVLVIASLLAYGLAPLVTFLERVLPLYWLLGSSVREAVE